MTKIPTDIKFQSNQIEILRVLGKIDIEVDNDRLEEAKIEWSKYGKTDKAFNDLVLFNKMQRMTCVRIYEATIPGGTKCFLKEYLPIGLPFGRRELLATRKLTMKWNAKIDRQTSNRQDNENDMDTSSITYDIQKDKMYTSTPPFPILLGSLRTDERIETQQFRSRWSLRFPRIRPPDAGNLWLIFLWDDSTFKTIKKFPPLPQIVEIFDYFRKDQRDQKRWRFIRKLMRKAVECVDFFHRNGFCHNAISSESIWLSTTNQQEITKVEVKLTNLGASQTLVELGPVASEGIAEDWYQLGLIFLELVIASFSEDNIGAQIARSILTGEKRVTENFLYRVEDVNLAQLTQKEIQSIFEDLCNSDFQDLRNFCRSIDNWKNAVNMLEQDGGLGWRFIFTLLTRGRLYDNNKEKKLRVSASSLINEYRYFFVDT